MNAMKNIILLYKRQTEYAFEKTMTNLNPEYTSREYLLHLTSYIQITYRKRKP